MEMKVIETICDTTRRPALLALVALALLTQSIQAAQRQRIVLRQGWIVQQLEATAAAQDATVGQGPEMTATMPAQVHDVLLQHGKILDPHVSRNAAESAWVGEKDWGYTCQFPTPQLGAGPVFLCLDGLDTLAKAYLNGELIGEFENMNRTYRVEVRAELVGPGQVNTLQIVFAAPLRFVEQVQQQPGFEGVAKFHYLRKSHSDFGSYLGARPHSAKVGIFRDVWLDIPGRAWIEDVWARPKLTDDLQSAVIQTQVEVGGADASVHWQLTDSEQKVVASGTGDSADGLASFQIEVTKPLLWWPRTHGSPHLYQLRTELVAGGVKLDEREQSIGIRRIKPVFQDAATGEKRFRFDINGQPIFLRGACWAPVEGMTHCWRPERATKLLDLLEHGRMNVLRIWGEGHIPPPEFFDECDRRGVLVWQDFMFGYGMHPSGNVAFDENCKIEIEQMVRRYRNHPSILLWCGGNENHMGWDFRYGGSTDVGCELFGEIMPQAVAQLDPDRHFHASSPYGGRVPNWPLEGDWHDYSTLKFCPESSVPLYASEIGRVSAPSLNSMKLFMTDEELWPDGFDANVRKPGQAAWPPMWQYRSVGGSWDKVGQVEQFCDPQNAAELVRVLGTAHGAYLRDRIERERRGVPDGAPDGTRRCWGNMVWRLNDSWPIIYWSLIDYYLEPKIPFYFARRAYEPVLVSFERTGDHIHVWVVNDSPHRIEGTLVVQRRQFKGDKQSQLQVEVEVGPGESKRCLSTDPFGPVYLRDEYLLADYAGHKATLLLIGERYLHLAQAKLSVTRVGDQLHISSSAFARQVSIEAEGVTGAVFEDNFFDLPPGEQRSVAILNAGESKRLTIKALNADPVVIE